MTYKELVDDIQIELKSRSESLKTQNPYWVLFRFTSEVSALRDLLLEKITSRSEIPQWMTLRSGVLSGERSNSGGRKEVFDEIVFARFTLPEAYYFTEKFSSLEAVPLMRQKTIFLDDHRSIMRRIRGMSESFSDYHYGYQEGDDLFVYPFIQRIYVNYVPKSFCKDHAAIALGDEIPAPDFVIQEARKKVIESILIQKQLPEDDKPDYRDAPPGGTATAKNRQ